MRLELRLCQPLKKTSTDVPSSPSISAPEKDGCAIITDFTTPGPYLDSKQPNSTVEALKGGTKTCKQLVSRSTAVPETLFSDALYQEIVSHFLSISKTNWYRMDASTNTCPPLLSIAITLDIRQGPAAQRLHRDDKNHYNGAMRIVLGRLWCDETLDFRKDGCKGIMDVGLKAREVFMMLGSWCHGGGEFRCEKGRREISYLSYPIEDVRGYNKVVQERLGGSSRGRNWDGCILRVQSVC
ncbi:uncharacterized protein BDR25DRAFT_338131 [Lindgomyces ingoldianus]|uniref:Uncharacterized protein n=1 Tax=Lindgomyces ingoldianus TaxID=673940 RepID=A0ACB6Q7N2_9PLEO|nr:uncharacterized protein BDR25DRAFT_338131 [Lindgomyces ingoldianus]KAF2462857.1 hypothetical protein BDR25DRAFT_338131 [Lindgomyces ingoldianus]